MSRGNLNTSALSDFAPRVGREQTYESEPTAPVDTQGAAWQRREPSHEGQFTIRASYDTIERFRKLCRDDRRTYAAMLDILMNAFEGRQ